MRERDVEKRFVDGVKKRGGEVRKVKWIGRAHAPDRLALFPPIKWQHSGRHVLVELKRPKKDATAGQQREHVRLRAAGFKVYVLNTPDGVDEFFRNHDDGRWSI